MYDLSKTFELENAFTALNGCIQYYTLTFTKAKLVDYGDKTADKDSVAYKKYQAAQANYMRVLEILRTYGGQPIITEVSAVKTAEVVTGATVKFTLEQASVYKSEDQLKDLFKKSDGAFLPAYDVVDGEIAFTASATFEVTVTPFTPVIC